MNALYVLFKVAAADYAIAAADVLQMESFTTATPVPGAPPYVAGLVQIRGRVVPVVDVRMRFGLPAAEPSAGGLGAEPSSRQPSLDRRVVVVQHGERVVSLLVDSAREVLSLDPASFRPPPEIVAEQAAGFVKAVAQAGGRLIMLIDCERVINEAKRNGN
jgi:purine-binding chemotaxis protein CheW